MESEEEKRQLEIQLKRLEIEKTDEELAALRIPWWKRPVYIAALFPTFLALVAATSAFVTGYVQTKYEITQFKADQLKKDQQEYGLKKDILDKEQGALKSNRDSYEKDKKDLEIARAKNAEETKKLQIAQENNSTQEADIKRQSEEFATKRTQLEQDVQTLATEKQAYETEKKLIDLKKSDLDYANALDRLERIEQQAAKEPQKGVSGESGMVLVELLKTKKSKRIENELTERARKLQNPTLKAHYLSILYLGTSELQWRDELFKLVRNNATTTERSFWSTFDALTWPDTERPVVIREIISALKDKPISERDSLGNKPFNQLFARDGAWNAVRSQLPKSTEAQLGNVRARFSGTDAFFDMLKFVRDEALAPKNEEYNRHTKFEILNGLSKPTCCVGVSQYILGSKTLPADAELAVYAIVGLGESSAFRKLYPYPQTTDRNEWIAWQDAYPALVKAATEADLKTWKQDPAAYDALFSQDGAPKR